jgi:hypothetical protein
VITYRHSQRGTLMYLVLRAGVLVALAIAAARGWELVPVIVAALLFVTLWLFHSLEVEITHSQIVLRFGPGIIQKTFYLREIRAARTVRNPWYYGWGIRLVPGGWMFNVSGLDAVEIDMANGKRYRIGTDEPGRLLEAIRRAAGLTQDSPGTPSASAGRFGPG